MIKTTIIAAAIGAALVVGYLLGERRAVRECNALPDARLQDLFRAMLDPDRPLPLDADDDPEWPATVLLH